MLKALFALMFLFVAVTAGFAQSTQTNLPDKMPVFEGGEPALFKHMAKNVNYPKEAKKNCVSGVVYVQFVINTRGNVHSAKVKQTLGYGCDEEAIRMIQTTSGKWSPAVKDNQAIDMIYSMPVRFHAQEGCSPFYLEFLETGNKWYEKGKYTKAILQYDLLLEIQPYHPEGLLKRGLSRLKMGDQQGACEDWNEIPDILNEKAQPFIYKYCK